MGNGLARFDGRQFRTFTADNTAALKAIGQVVWSLSEDIDGTIWAGVFGGLLRIRGLEFTAFTNGLPQRFVLQAEPAGDGSVWVAGFNDFVPRGPLWLRRYHPNSGTSSAEVIVPGHLRRLVGGRRFGTRRSRVPLALGRKFPAIVGRALERADRSQGGLARCVPQPGSVAR
jgi:hypothetical protein